MNKLPILFAAALALSPSMGCESPAPNQAASSSPPPPPSAPAPSVARATKVAKTPAPSAPPPITKAIAEEEAKPEGVETRIHFRAGASTGAVEGSVLRGERNRYLIRAGHGQRMQVSISSLENNASFTLIQPDGKTVAGTEEERDHPPLWKGTLPLSGDYVIVVGPTRGNATYRLEVSIKN